MRRPLAAMLVPLALVVASACAAEHPSRPDGPVVDQASILPDAAERALDVKLRRYFDSTCRAVVVATVSSLGGQSIEAYARELANGWKIGDPIRGEGILLLVAPAEHKVRIEVSRSLHAALPDAAASEIIQKKIIVRFRANDLQGGVAQGADSIMNHLDTHATRHPDCGQRQSPES